MKRILTIALIALTASLACLADIPRPERPSGRVEKPKASVLSQMTIKLDRNASEAKLIIPRSQLKELRAELESIDEPGGFAATGFQKTQMIAGGSLISLAVIMGGLWFARTGRRPGRGSMTAVLALAALLGGAATMIHANIGPPPEARTINGKMFSESVHRYKFGSGKVRLELSDANEIVFIVPDQKSPAAGEE